MKTPLNYQTDYQSSRKEKLRQYHRHYQRQRRKRFKVVAVSIPKDKQEQILQAAKEHQLSLAQFLLQSSLHYLNQSFLLPNPEQVSHLRQLLSLWHSDFSRLISQTTEDDMVYTIKLIQQRVSMLENQINDLFTNPIPVPKPAYDH